MQIMSMFPKDSLFLCMYMIFFFNLLCCFTQMYSLIWPNFVLNHTCELSGFCVWVLISTLLNTVLTSSCDYQGGIGCTSWIILLINSAKLNCDQKTLKSRLSNGTLVCQTVCNCFPRLQSMNFAFTEQSWKNFTNWIFLINVQKIVFMPIKHTVIKCKHMAWDDSHLKENTQIKGQDAKMYTWSNSHFLVRITANTGLLLPSLHYFAYIFPWVILYTCIWLDTTQQTWIKSA